MSFGTSPLNRTNTDIGLQDVLNLLKKDILLNLNCHAIATIQSFDSVLQTVSATINYKKTYLQPNSVTGVYTPIAVDYPVLLQCPVIVMMGGSGALTLPIAKGDNCLLLFNDRDIDDWFTSGQVGPVATQRLHGFSDAIALIGLNSMVSPLLNYDPDRVVLRNGNLGLTQIAVGSTKVEISNALFNLNSLLQDLVTEIKNLVNATAAITVICAAPSSPSSVPVNAAAILAVATNLTATALQIGELLE